MSLSVRDDNVGSLTFRSQLHRVERPHSRSGLAEISSREEVTYRWITIGAESYLFENQRVLDGIVSYRQPYAGAGSHQLGRDAVRTGAHLDALHERQRHPGGIVKWRLIIYDIGKYIVREIRVNSPALLISRNFEVRRQISHEIQGILTFIHPGEQGLCSSPAILGRNLAVTRILVSISHFPIQIINDVAAAYKPDVQVVHLASVPSFVRLGLKGGAQLNDDVPATLGAGTQDSFAGA